MKVLFVNSCIRAEQSRTLRLCKAALEQIQQSCGPVEQEELNLMEEALLPMDRATLEKRDQLGRVEAFDDPMFRYARQFAQADLIVVGAPYWDYAFPAMLKCYLERVSVCGVTFRYEGDRSVGMCRARRLLYLTTSGGPIGERNFGFQYLQGLCKGLLGIENVEWAGAEALDVIGVDVEEQLRKAEQALRAQILGWQ